jgi:hypothetical protein
LETTMSWPPWRILNAQVRATLTVSATAPAAFFGPTNDGLVEAFDPAESFHTVLAPGQ